MNVYTDGVKKVGYVLVWVAVILLLISPLFIKVKIECRSQFGECPSEINSKLQVLNSKYLFIAKGKAKTILKQELLISNFSQQLKLPNILVINILTKQPHFAILSKSQNKYLLVDSSGTILGESDKSDLPTVVKDTVTEKSGQKIENTDLFALKLIEGINEMYQINIGVTQNDTLLVDMPTGIRVILPLAGTDTDVLLGSLRLIYTKVTTDSPGVYSQIDMRFKNPVIR